METESFIKNRLLFLLFLLAGFKISISQVARPFTLPLALIKEFPESYTDFEIDNLGFLYLVGKGQQLKKIAANEDSIAVYNDVRRYGQLFSIDVSNPLKVLLFYRDFGTVLILDRFLNVKTVVDLRKNGLLQPTCITQSYDNNIWVYDELESRIFKVDEAGKKIVSSPDFRIVFDTPPQPSSLTDYNKYLYAYDSLRGLMVMDYFGAYKNIISLRGLSNIHGINKGIAGTDQTGLVYYQPGSLNFESYPLQKEILHAKKIRVMGDKLYALQENGKLGVYFLP